MWGLGPEIEEDGLESGVAELGREATGEEEKLGD